jgi:hypothetical protein
VGHCKKTEKLMTKTLKISIILSILFIGLIRFIPLWERTPGGFWNLLFYLGIATLFFWILTKIIIEIIRIIKKRKELSISTFLPLIILTIAFLDGTFNPLKIDLEKIYGKTVFRAFYEGTQNQATFKLRESGKFDIHWTGVFFYDEFFTGNYKMIGDTILMDFNTEIPRILGDTLIIKDENLYRLKSDTLISTYFYLGYCKGLN